MSYFRSQTSYTAVKSPAKPAPAWHAVVYLSALALVMSCWFMWCCAYTSGGIDEIVAAAAVAEIRNVMDACNDSYVDGEATLQIIIDNCGDSYLEVLFPGGF